MTPHTAPHAYAKETKMSKTNELTTLSFDTLATVAGGQNVDSHTTIGNGTILDRQYKSRTDDAYKMDMRQQACELKATTTERSLFGGERKVVDQQKVAACMEQYLK